MLGQRARLCHFSLFFSLRVLGVLWNTGAFLTLQLLSASECRVDTKELGKAIEGGEIDTATGGKRRSVTAHTHTALGPALTPRRIAP